MGFKFGSPFSSPYFLGSFTPSSTTRGAFDVSLGSHDYMLDWSAERALTYAPVPFIRQQADQSPQPGEQTVNPEGLWRRSGESWHMGAGQEDYDRRESNEYRFRDSKGVDIWTRFQFGLLPDTEIKDASGNANLRLAIAGPRLYYVDADTMSHTTDITPSTPTFTSVTGLPANAPSSITSDGYHVWTAHGTDGVYRTNRTINASSSHVTGTVDTLGYVRNRVMAASGANLYDITAVAMGSSGALPAAHFTHPNIDWEWVDFAENNGFIFAAGKSGDKSLIYKIGIENDATSLLAPAVAGTLPDGEEITHINGYLGNFMFIGTTLGYRLAFTSDSGELRIGSRINTPNPVVTSEPQDNFIWYGLTNFDSTSSGLGRLSTSDFTDLDRLVPAYASDLMTDNLGECLSVVTFQGLRVFTISQVGLIAQHETDLVEEGHIDTGRITYGMTENKVGIWFDIQHSEMSGHHEVLASYDGSPFVTLGRHGVVDAVHSEVTHFMGVVEATAFEFRLVLNRAMADPSSGLLFRSWLFRVQPTADPTDYIYATVLLAPVVDNRYGTPQEIDTYMELDYFVSLRTNRALTRWQQGRRIFNVFLEDFELSYRGLMIGGEGHTGFNGSCLLKMKVVN